MYELRCLHQTYASLLGLRQDFTQSLERRRMRMSDRDGFALFPGPTQRQFDLFAHCRDFRQIVEERHVAECGANAKVLRRFDEARRERRAWAIGAVALALLAIWAAWKLTAWIRRTKTA